MKSLAHRFWRKVQQGDEDQCWPWTGYTHPSGHGLTTMDGTSVLTSRKAWVLTYGPIRGKLCVLHRCDNPRCCNPKHMYLGTRADNMIDRWDKTPPDQRIPRDRTTVLGPEEIQSFNRMRGEGMTVLECATKLGVHHCTIYRAITAQRRSKLQKLRADRMSSVSQ